MVQISLDFGRKSVPTSDSSRLDFPLDWDPITAITGRFLVRA